MIIPTWKKVGDSTHQLAKKIGDINHAKATHTGTLDPMASGVVIILTDQDRFKKSKLSSWKKNYEFEILFGFSTDSLDLLGLVNNQIKKHQLDTIELKNKIKKILPKFLGEQKQIQPKFSAQRVKGKSAFDFAKKNIFFEQKINNINIYSLNLEDIKLKEIKKLENEIIENIKLVSGNFRQKQIMDEWKNIFSKLEKNKIKYLPVVKLTAQVSSKTYIRALVRDISKKLNLWATTYSITRTKNGIYSKQDCS